MCIRDRCTAGGTMLQPVTDKWLCDYLIPPGMERIQPDPSFSWYITAHSWRLYHDYVVLMSVIYGYDSGSFIGYILQGRTDNVPNGFFITTKNATGRALDCGLYTVVSRLFAISYQFTINRTPTDHCKRGFSCS